MPYGISSRSPGHGVAQPGDGGIEGEVPGRGRVVQPAGQFPGVPGAVLVGEGGAEQAVALAVVEVDGQLAQDVGGFVGGVHEVQQVAVAAQKMTQLAGPAGVRVRGSLEPGEFDRGGHVQVVAGADEEHEGVGVLQEECGQPSAVGGGEVPLEVPQGADHGAGQPGDRGADDPETLPGQPVHGRVQPAGHDGVRLQQERGVPVGEAGDVVGEGGELFVALLVVGVRAVQELLVGVAGQQR